MSSEAPGDLEIARAFVNTLDIEAGTDALRDAGAWESWSAERGHGAGSPPPSEADLRRARDLREALRLALLANHDRAPLPGETVAALNSAADWLGLRPTFSPDGVAFGAGEAAGLKGFVARSVAAVAASIGDGTWQRLKACRNDECRWAFYDESRSRTGRWCSMGICGNRTKQARFRERHSDEA